MFEDRMFREAEFLKAIAPLPVLSSGLRSRVLAAALEAQDRRSQGRRVLASALGLFAMLVGVAWMGPFSNRPFFEGRLFSESRPFSESDGQMSAASSAGLGGAARKGATGDPALSALSSLRPSLHPSLNPSLHPSLNRGQVLMSVVGDDWQSVEAQLRSRQEHFSRFQM